MESGHTPFGGGLLIILIGNYLGHLGIWDFKVNAKPWSFCHFFLVYQFGALSFL